MNSRHQNQRGGALIIVLLIAGAIAIVLTSFIKLGLTSLDLADRSFYSNSAMNLAESGLEEAVLSLNNLTSVATPADAWTGWSLSGSHATQTLSGYSVGPGATGVVKVYCDEYNPAPSVQPEIVAEATISMPDGPTIAKTIRIKVRRRALFGVSLAARDQITIAANCYFDSWDSDPDDNPATPHLPYNPALQSDEIMIGTASAAAGALDMGGSTIDVHGAIASGGSPPMIGTGATIQNDESPPSPSVDSSLVTTDFAADFPPVTVPTPLTANIVSTDLNTTLSLPRVGDLANAADGRYYYVFDASAKVRLTSNDFFTITDDVTFIFDNHSGDPTIQMQSNNEIVLASTASLEIYTNGNITMFSNTAINPTGSASQCLVFGTNPTVGGQTILFNSNETNNVAIYAPNADFRADSNVVFNGALVANTVDIAANGFFHYDEALSEPLGDEPYGVAEWEELRSATRRAAYASVLSF